MQPKPTSQADMAASLIAGTGQAEHKAQTHPVMVRLPVYTVSKIDALVRHTGKSRAGVMQLLFSIGWEEVTVRLDGPLLEKLLHLDGEAMAALLDEDKSSQQVL